MEIPFTKLHGNGNDFVLIDEHERTVIPDEMKAEFAALYCDRRLGIGADGVLFLSKSTTSDIRMRILQPDLSEAEMCGNGVRCLAKYAFDAGYVKERFTVETLAGPVGVEARYTDEDFTAIISMPEPKFERKDIPATGDGEYHEQIGGFEVYAVNTGVPHAVILVDAVDSVDIAAAAPPIRRHATLPEGANVNFVQKTGDDSIRVRTYERGVEDETLSCGTGATASAAVVHHLGYMKGPVQVETRGGPLTISFEGGTKMEGPAVTVFAGVIVY
ncbi:diaminopimelate epimerase [Methanoregula sp.]|uniref:diaminopimelate epimerase n=1 Tax=Methanoregula sp. TaxID=2052170 RepID=UPI002CFB4462|nr:diaminopimelate epimerase [Methanoregula sp.]HVP95661.1 diaminopimelate epimerase [Methanoregula sp.]